MGEGGLEPLPLGFSPLPPPNFFLYTSPLFPSIHWGFFFGYTLPKIKIFYQCPLPIWLIPTPTPLPIFHQKPPYPCPFNSLVPGPTVLPHSTAAIILCHECQPRSIKLYGCRPMNSISTRQWSAMWLSIIIFLQNRYPTACLRAQNVGCILSV